MRPRNMKIKDILYSINGRGIASTLDALPQITITISDVVIREEADLERLAEHVAGRLADELARQKQLKGLGT